MKTSRIGRKSFLKVVLSSILPLWSGGAFAQRTEQRSVLIGVFEGAGTEPDVAVRIITQELNRTGSFVATIQNLQAPILLRAKSISESNPDGALIFLSNDQIICMLPLVVKPTFGIDPNREVVPIAGFGTYVDAFAISADVSPKSFSEYIDWAKNGGASSRIGLTEGLGGKPDRLELVRPGAGSVREIGPKYPATTHGLLIRIVSAHYGIPYKGVEYAPNKTQDMYKDLKSGALPACVDRQSRLLAGHKDGSHRILATTGAVRQQTSPDVPTFAELGLSGVEQPRFHGFYGPRGLPKAIVAQFEEGVRRALGRPDVRDGLRQASIAPRFMSSDELSGLATSFRTEWEKVISLVGFAPD